MTLRTWLPFLGLLLAVPAVSTAQHPDGEMPDHQHSDHAMHHAALSRAPSAEKVEGLSVPDVTLLDQDGHEVHFYRDLVQDRTVAMSFIFTTCKTICPPIGANFGKLQNELRARYGDELGKEIQLISVTVDPTTDTPERLKAWGETFGAGPGWSLVTGNKSDVDRLLKGLQVFTPDYVDHTPTLLLGNDATGEWTRAYGLLAPPKLEEMIQDLAEGKKASQVASATGKGAG
jgi:protein SCO1/2